MEEKNTNPGEKKPGEGQEWPPVAQPGQTGKQGGDVGEDVGKKGGGMGEPEGTDGDNRKSGDTGKEGHE